MDYEKDLQLILDKMDYLETEEEKKMTLMLVLNMLQFS